MARHAIAKVIDDHLQPSDRSDQDVLGIQVATLLAAAGERTERDSPIQTMPFDPLVEPLTEREREVLQLLMDGASNNEIAEQLVLSVNTVKKHVFNVCSKLGVQSRTQAIVRARHLNLL
jgi:LuxR family maltose regulon positive regulatory protein